MFKKESSNAATSKIILVLMDCEMPIMDGYEASKKIRDFENVHRSEQSEEMSEADRLLIIGLSGNQGDSYQRKCRLAGMSDSITKPVGIE